jgi:hypothetical protein
MNQNGWFFVHRSPIVCPSPSETTPTTHNNEPKDNEEDTLNDWVLFFHFPSDRPSEFILTIHLFRKGKSSISLLTK